MRWGAARGFFEQAGVSLHEVDVEEEVDGDGAEVEEGCEEAPILRRGIVSEMWVGRVGVKGPELTCDLWNTVR